MNSTLAPLFSTDAQRWQALVQRNPDADGAFLYAVQTTGVYCRPTCASRLPNPKNVVFFQHGDEAEKAGFRPCKRCQPHTLSPQQQQVAAIAQVCQLIEQSESPLSLQQMAQTAGLSQYHFHRLFKQIIGITPKAYINADRARRIRTALHQEASITQAIHQAGFETSSRFYEQSTLLLGMTPTQYRQGASGIEIRFAVKPCWLGWVLVAATPQGICAIAFDDTAEALTAQIHQQFPHAQIQDSDRPFETWVEQVLTLIETPESRLNLPLDVQGTAFQQQVWQALQKIPLGSTASYAEIARQIDRPQAVRAVARACATNQIAVAIPCHRVVGSDGSLRGYRWGSDRKYALLEREQSSQTHLPTNP